MELQFDKEIDALLRNTPFASTADAAGHLDADEIAAFAENAVPLASREAQIAHLAICTRCRKILAVVVELNAESLPIAADADAAAPEAMRPARRWFAALSGFPGLAYGLGALVLVFAGFLVFSVIRSTRNDAPAEVSRVSEPVPAASSDPQIDTTQAPANTATNSDSAPLAARESANDTVAAGPRDPASQNADADAVAPRAKNADAFPSRPKPVTESNVPPAPRPAAQPAPKDREEKQRADAQTSPSVLESVSPAADEKREASAKPPAKGTDLSKAKADSEEESVMDSMLRGRQNSSTREDSNLASPVRKSVAGRTFELRRGVWYDAAYAGQPTLSIRRGTDAFAKLEPSVRAAVAGLGGTVVVVSNAKAYRIQ